MPSVAPVMSTFLPSIVAACGRRIDHIKGLWKQNIRWAEHEVADIEKSKKYRRDRTGTSKKISLKNERLP
jgi:hypothetical protein